MNATRSSRIILAGGAGYLGRHLACDLVSRGHEVVILTRTAFDPDPGIRVAVWDGVTRGDWTAELSGARAVINLAGRSVNCRYTEKNRQEIYESRLLSTQVLGRAIAAAAEPPPVWINSSSATIYRHALDRPMDEATGEIGEGFSVDVCQKWEQALAEANTPATRKIAIRTAMVFGPGSGGVYEAFRRIVRLGLGGSLGRGDQYVSWVHLTDFCAGVRWLVDHARDPDLGAAVNISSPFPIPNNQFMATFREAYGKRVGLPASRWMLEMGAIVLRTETELLLKSRRVVPGTLVRHGFQFQFPHLRDALAEIVAREAEGATPVVPSAA